MNIQQVNAARDAAHAAVETVDELRSAYIAELQRLNELAGATTELLSLVRREADYGYGGAKESTAVWDFREQLEPLANSLGFTIVESDTTKNRAVIAQLENIE